MSFEAAAVANLWYSGFYWTLDLEQNAELRILLRCSPIPIDETSGVALELKTGVPSYQAEDEEGRTHLLIYFAIEEQHEDRWCLWRPDHAGFDSRSIFEGALIEE